MTKLFLSARKWMSGEYGEGPSREDTLSLEGPGHQPLTCLHLRFWGPWGFCSASLPLAAWSQSDPISFCWSQSWQHAGTVSLVSWRSVFITFRQPVVQALLLRKLAFPLALSSDVSWPYAWSISGLHPDPLIYTSYPRANATALFTLDISRLESMSWNPLAAEVP